MNISGNDDSSKNHSIYIWVVIFIIIIGCLYFLLIKNNSVTNSETGQVIMIKTVVAGSNEEYVLEKGSVVEVSKEYFLPQVLLPSSEAGVKRFDTPSPIYSQVGTGVYFTNKDASEIIPFKGKLREGAIGYALSLGFIINRLIVFGFFIILITIIIFIKNKFRKNGNQ